MAIVKIWTVTTDGNECEPTTTAHGSEAKAKQRVIADIRHDHDDVVGLDLASTEALQQAWQELNKGYCAIEEHEVAV